MFKRVSPGALKQSVVTWREIDSKINRRKRTEPQRRLRRQNGRGCKIYPLSRSNSENPVLSILAF